MLVEFRKGKDEKIHRVAYNRKRALCGEQVRANRVVRRRDAERHPNRCLKCDQEYAKSEVNELGT